MSQTFEIPHLRTSARHALPNLVHGTFVPLALFRVPELLANLHARRFILRSSTLWALAGLVDVTIVLWLLLSQPVATFVVARTVVSAALTVCAVAGSTVWFKRSMQRHGGLAAKTMLASA